MQFITFYKKRREFKTVITKYGRGQATELRTSGEGISAPREKLNYNIFHLYSYTCSVKRWILNQALGFLSSAKVVFSVVFVVPSFMATVQVKQ